MADTFSLHQAFLADLNNDGMAGSLPVWCKAFHPSGGMGAAMKPPPLLLSLYSFIL
jgi:hypothetical protein